MNDILGAALMTSLVAIQGRITDVASEYHTATIYGAEGCGACAGACTGCYGNCEGHNR